MTNQAVTTTEPQTQEIRLRDSVVEFDKRSGRLVPQTLGEVVQFANAMAQGGITIRKHLRGEPGACLAVSLQAFEWGMSPFALANKSYSVNDQLAYEATVFVAVINSRAPIKGRPKYRFEGEGDKRVCICTVIVDDGDGGWEPLEHRSPEFGKITPKNSPLWKSDSDQQQSYYTVRAMVRLHFPEITMGALDLEEAAQSMPESEPGGRELSGLAARLPGGETEGFDPTHVAQLGGGEGDVIEAEVTEIGAAEGDPAAEDEDEGGWVVLENHEGPAPTGIVYLLASDLVGADDKLPTYQDGAAFSRVGQMGAAKLPQYTEHPAIEQLAPVEEVDDADGGAIRQTPEDRVESVNETAADADQAADADGGFLADMRKADSWLQIKTLNTALSKTPEWQGVGEEERDEMRRAIWGVVAEMKKRTRDPVDQADDASAFRLWLSTQDGKEGADAIEGTLRSLRKSPGWAKLKPEQQASLMAVAKERATACAGA